MGSKQIAERRIICLSLTQFFINPTERKKKPVYVAYVDFAKFFDSINREHLYYKLIKLGIGGNTLSIIKTMYDNANYTIKINNKLYGSIDSKTDVKQGCCLSPLLSNLFQNDLSDIFTDY